MSKLSKYKQKVRQAVVKRIKITKNGKLLRSHQFRTAHLKRSKSKSTLRRHKRMVGLSKTTVKSFRRMLGLS